MDTAHAPLPSELQSLPPAADRLEKANLAPRQPPRPASTTTNTHTAATKTVPNHHAASKSLNAAAKSGLSPAPLPPTPPHTAADPTTTTTTATTGGGDPEVKKKRRVLLASQLEILERSFAISQSPSNPVRADLAVQLEIPERNVQIWFQNRRAKYKRTAELSAAAASANGGSKVPAANRSTAASAGAASARGPVKVYGIKSNASKSSSKSPSAAEKPTAAVRSAAFAATAAACSQRPNAAAAGGGSSRPALSKSSNMNVTSPAGSTTAATKTITANRRPTAASIAARRRDRRKRTAQAVAYPPRKSAAGIVSKSNSSSSGKTPSSIMTSSNKERRSQSQTLATPTSSSTQSAPYPSPNMVACEAMAAAQQQFEAMSCVDIDGELAGAAVYIAGDEFLTFQDPRDPHASVYARMLPFQTPEGFPREMDMEMDMDMLVSSQPCCYPCYMDCCYSTAGQPPPLQVPGRPIGSLSPSLTDELHFGCSGALSANTTTAPLMLHDVGEQHQQQQDDDLAAFTDASVLPPLYFSQEVADREPSAPPAAPEADATGQAADSAAEDPASQEEQLPTSSPAQQQDVMSSPSAVDPLDKLPMYPQQQQLHHHHHQAAGMYPTPLANTSYLALPIEYAYTDFYLQQQQQQQHQNQHHHQFAVPPPPCQVHRARTFYDDFALHSSTASVPPAMHPARRRHSVATPYDLSCLAGFADPMAAAAAAAEALYQPSTTAYEISNGAFYAY
ncbi:hypothetical protein BDZ88DRAFT_431319 [Geranomyces variabilis]|nr:hypothetical protein BDZ88DRAFT_431319 [Geranomyces variabilis]KAJ3131596.1 hypothetical protein HDU90_008197 [Geranomyces variabilis]